MWTFWIFAFPQNVLLFICDCWQVWACVSKVFNISCDLRIWQKGHCHVSLNDYLSKNLTQISCLTLFLTIIFATNINLTNSPQVHSRGSYPAPGHVDVWQSWRWAETLETNASIAVNAPLYVSCSSLPVCVLCVKLITHVADITSSQTRRFWTICYTDKGRKNNFYASILLPK